MEFAVNASALFETHDKLDLASTAFPLPFRCPDFEKFSARLAGDWSDPPGREPNVAAPSLRAAAWGRRGPEHLSDAFRTDRGVGRRGRGDADRDESRRRRGWEVERTRGDESRRRREPATWTFSGRGRRSDALVDNARSALADADFAWVVNDADAGDDALAETAAAEDAVLRDAAYRRPSANRRSRATREDDGIPTLQR